ncbi:unnamed protein product [Pseudo-nitzschia multistriata]|uniref:Uncharacterized protein n=1 Tax=Pseudo-nitzschia multistriata TaxID=183589 RepID=A0A448Z058_9STRA|nr:unnamed protein product [Pseudo-nitzschia multistriata]
MSDPVSEQYDSCGLPEKIVGTENDSEEAESLEFEKLELMECEDGATKEIDMPTTPSQKKDPNSSDGEGTEGAEQEHGTSFLEQGEDAFGGDDGRNEKKDDDDNDDAEEEEYNDDYSPEADDRKPAAKQPPNRKRSKKNPGDDDGCSPRRNTKGTRTSRRTRNKIPKYFDDEDDEDAEEFSEEGAGEDPCDSKPPAAGASASNGGEDSAEEEASAEENATEEEYKSNSEAQDEAQDKGKKRKADFQSPDKTTDRVEKSSETSQSSDIEDGSEEPAVDNDDVVKSPKKKKKKKHADQEDAKAFTNPKKKIDGESVKEEDEEASMNVKKDNVKNDNVKKEKRSSERKTRKSHAPNDRMRDLLERKKTWTKKKETKLLTVKDVRKAYETEGTNKDDALLSMLMAYYIAGVKAVTFDKLFEGLGHRPKNKAIEKAWKEVRAENLVEEAPATAGGGSKKAKKVFRLTQKGFDRAAPEGYEEETLSPAKTSDELHDIIKGNAKNNYSILVFEILLEKKDEGVSLTTRELADECGVDKDSHGFFYGFKWLKDNGYAVSDGRRKNAKYSLSEKCFVD